MSREPSWLRFARFSDIYEAHVVELDAEGHEKPHSHGPKYHDYSTGFRCCADPT